MSEYLTFRGWLAEKELDVRELELKMTGLRDAIRQNLSDLMELEELRCEVAMEQAIELAALQIRLKELRAEIAAKKKAYGAA